jgi:hypothetical protein
MRLVPLALWRFSLEIALEHRSERLELREVGRVAGAQKSCSARPVPASTAEFDGSLIRSVAAEVTANPFPV